MDIKNIDSKKKNIIVIISIIVGVILIALGIGLYIISKTNDTEIEQPQEIIEEIITTDDEEGARNLQNELKALNATYSDAIAWLKVPGTNIDTPIYQAADNNRYLRNDRDGNTTSWGETFMDYDSKEDLSGYTNLVVYGHNTTTDDHFTPLLNYSSKEFYDANKVIEMSTLEGNYKWEIFTVFITDANDFYIDTNFNNDEEFATFVSYFKAKSFYDTGVQVSKDDDILTLSTCEYTQTNGRFVVMAKLIK